MSPFRRAVYLNSTQEILREDLRDTTQARRFHESLPQYQQSKLVRLPKLAQELGLKEVYVKDESKRVGLSSFKILGASWGVFCAIASKLGLEPTTTLDTLATKAQDAKVKLVTATDGNHGMAVARMGQILSVSVTIFVPSGMTEATKQLLLKEGANVIPSTDYDTAVKSAAAFAVSNDAILVQDTAFPGYEDIPSRIVDGYSTMLHEVDDQLKSLADDCTHVITPVGVGSLAESVTRHYKSQGRSTKIIAIEPDTAACLWKSLHAQKPDPIRTSDTIMTGMDCGTVSLTAWPVLSKHVDACITVSDFEAHRAVEYLQENEIASGPCGAAPVAALRYLARHCQRELGLDKNATVVLLNTEGPRGYRTPFDVSSDDPVVLTQILTQILSTNPTLSSEEGSGENEIANYVEAWLQHRNIETHRVESHSGRPSIVGIARGSGKGKSLMINGHIDTVSISNYIPGQKPLGGTRETRHGREIILGRGCLDMKAGVAAGMAAIAHANQRNLGGDVMIAAVSDEEHLSIGTEDVLAAGWTADAAVVPEPTNLELGAGCMGFVWVEVEIEGFAAHGSRPDLGVDAIMQSRKFLDALHEYSTTLPSDDLLGKASLHCGLIQGGVEPSTYPASCKTTIEFRTVPGQTPEAITADLIDMLSMIAKKDQSFKFKSPEVTVMRPASKVPSDHPFMQLVSNIASGIVKQPIQPKGMPFWCDAALLGASGIPSVIIGPSGEGLHAQEEWVDVESIRQTYDLLVTTIAQFCR